MSKANTWIRELHTTAPMAPFEGGAPRLIVLLPIAVVGAWWTISFALYAANWPIVYTHENLVGVSLLTLGTLVLSVAAFVAVNRRPTWTISPVLQQRPAIAMLVGLWVSLLLLIPYAELYSGYHLWQLGNALLDQGEAFAQASERIAEGTGSRIWIVVIQTAAAPLTLCVLPYFALAWFERRQFITWLLLSAAVPITQSLLVGRDFQMVVAGVLIAITWMVSRVRRRLYFSWRDAAVIVGGLAVFLVAFGARKMSRNPTLADLCMPGANTCVESPTIWNYIIASFSSYSSHSFEGLGRALNAEWSFGGGYSHSPALRGIIEGVLPSGSVVVTDQLEQLEWHATHFWSTGLAWIANDVPWVLVPLVVALQALLLAVTWRRTIRQADWLSLGVFGYSFLSLFFMMQNLQLALSGPTQLGYLALVIAFLVREARDQRALGARGSHSKRSEVSPPSSTA